MPERKRLFRGTRWRAHFVAAVVASVQRAAKKWPRKTGAISREGRLATQRGCGRGRSTAAALESEAEIGKVAVTYRDAGVRHQQAIDRDHHPIEHAGGRYDPQ